MPRGSRAARVLRDPVFVVLALGAIVLGALDPGRIATWPSLVDVPTVEALTGLLVLTHGVEASGALQAAAGRLLVSIEHERSLAFVLIGIAGVVSMFVTNDVALFVVVPLTRALASAGDLPLARLVAFEAIAVNAGSALTPFGNPQNLFLWGRSGATIPQFVATTAPVVAIATVVLVAFAWFAFAPRAIAVRRVPRPPVDRRLFALSIALYVPFLVAADLRRTGIALVVVLVLYALVARHVLGDVDWGLIAIFVLMFVDLRLAADLPSVSTWMATIPWHVPLATFAASTLLSQVVSNVPAAILVDRYSDDWQAVAWGVTVGGFGLFIGSLANLIAMRLARQRGVWRVFHLYSLPFFLAVALLAAAWLALRS